MKKISFTASNSIIVKYVLKSLILSALCVILLTLCFSEFLFKLDLPTEGIKYITVVICFISSLVTSYFATSSFKNNGVLLGVISQIPLAVFIVVNFALHKNDVAFVLIKIAVIFVTAAAAGAIRIKQNNIYKV